jgi:exopolyphosphatase / guanosine-5'-triphosphate,3'-diphosphate pyrophosphatase
MTDETQGTIVPRWEWRTFAPSLKSLEVKLAPLAGVAPRDSAEIYILHLGGPQNAKIRNDTFDVKRLREVDANGLELWEPVIKAKFPLGRSDIVAAYAQWQLPLPHLRRESYTVEAFIGELIAAEPALRVAHVAKSRRCFALAGCIAEFVTLTVDLLPLESFSLEHEEPARILRALRDLGFEAAANTSYPAGLKLALGLEDAQRQHGHAGALHG